MVKSTNNSRLTRGPFTQNRDRYCHKFVSTRPMRGFGVDIHAPRPPFVLAKVVYRWVFTANAFLTAPYAVLRVVFKVLAAVVGYFVGLVFGGVGGGKQQQQPASRDPRIPRPEWGPDLGFMDDEYL